MKKLLGIMVLSSVLTFSSNGISEEKSTEQTIIRSSNNESGEMNLWKKKIKLPEDVAQGYVNAWKFCCNYDPETRLTPAYAFKIVNKSDGHPVRLGEQSIRFEVRPGDCGLSPGGYDDCKHNSERHELNAIKEVNSLKGVTWHTYSLYLPKDFPLDGYEWIGMGQFHTETSVPAFNFNVGYQGYELERRTACSLPENKNKDCSSRDPQNYHKMVIHQDDLRGQWHDMVFNGKWSVKQKGFFKMWVNGKLVYHYQGSNLTSGEKEGFNFGIYREPKKNTPKEVTQVAYYDEIRYAKKSCKKLKLEDLGYSCADLEKQIIDSIDTIGTDCLENNLCTKQDLKNNYMAVIKSKDDENYLIKVKGKTEERAKKKGLYKCKTTGNTGCYVHYSGETPKY